MSSVLVKRSHQKLISSLVKGLKPQPPRWSTGDSEWSWEETTSCQMSWSNSWCLFETESPSPELVKYISVGLSGIVVVVVASVKDKEEEMSSLEEYCSEELWLFVPGSCLLTIIFTGLEFESWQWNLGFSTDNALFVPCSGLVFLTAWPWWSCCGINLFFKWLCHTFFISLSVRPGNVAAIADHLQFKVVNRPKTKTKDTINLVFICNQMGRKSQESRENPFHLSSLAFFFLFPFLLQRKDSS